MIQTRERYLKAKVAQRLGHLRDEQLPAANRLVQLSIAKLGRLRSADAPEWEIEEESLHLARYQRDLETLKQEIAEHEASAMQ